MKKPLVVTLAVISLVLIGSIALACWEDGYWDRGGPGRGHGGGNYSDAHPGYQNFLNDTAKLRQELAAKRGEYNAMMASPNPDPQKAGQLSQEMTLLHDQLQAKAQSYGMAAPGPYGALRGGYGFGPGYGGWACY
jgi:zinc resistance-associated protein